MIAWALVSLTLFSAIVWGAMQELKGHVEKGQDPKQVRRDAMPALFAVLMISIAIGGLLVVAWKFFLYAGMIAAVGFGAWWLAAKAIDRSLGRVKKPNDPA